MTSVSERLHYFDNIRALAMLLGIFLHAALAYSPHVNQVWLTADPENSEFFDVFFVFIHLFRMPLFFLVSGYFAMLLIEKQGWKGLLVNRCKRILLPFIIFLPLLGIVTFVIIIWAMDAITISVPILETIKAMSQPPEDEPMDTMHLWFLLNLFFFCVFLAMVMAVFPRQTRLLLSQVTGKWVLALMPLLIIPALLSVPAPTPPPSKFFPQWWSFGYFGLFFLLGGAFRLRPSLINDITPYQGLLWLLGMAGFVGFCYFLPEPMNTEQAMVQMRDGMPFSTGHLVLVCLQSFASVYISLGALILGKLYLSTPSKTMRYLMDASYWMYLVHIPLLFWIQFLLIDTAMNVWFKFLLSCGVVFALSVISYQLLVRHTFVGRLLNGKVHKA